ncbi:helix-turn-helix domain-containing protein [Brachybacterium sp. NPDC056505]|uniref:helix-turn-helix domain-containing protein n=1 Tax=Brachybacterium sp. NPDC056505 TaxID=3345843 RepID=UPI00366FC6C7
MDSFTDYLAEITGGASQAAIARVADLDQSNVSRWRKGAKPSPEAVIRIAHHYGRPVPEALYRAGLVSEETAKRLRVTDAPGLSSYPYPALLRELGRRLAHAEHTPHTIQSPADYGEEPSPDDYDLAAGTADGPIDRPRP